jgi:acetyl esterase
MYLQNCKGLEKIDASPFHAELPNIIPETYIETAQFDCLHDEGILYAERLKHSGTKVTLVESKGTIHGYYLNLDSEITKKHIMMRIIALQNAFSR